MVWIFGSLARKITRGTGFRLADGCLGAELGFVAMAWALLQIFWIADGASSPDRGPAIFGMSCFFVLALAVMLAAVSARRSWAEELDHALLTDVRVYRSALFWLCAVALNVAGSALLATLLALRGYGG